MPRTMKMRTLLIGLLVFAYVSADDPDKKTIQRRFFSKLHGKHHKRGTLSGVPPYKLGHDIPVVSHSLIKPFVVTYPPTALPVTVKVPLINPLVHKYSPSHKIPPHNNFEHKFPPHSKPFYVSKPDHHYHHHHHHVPRPVVPVIPTVPAVPATPIVPVAQPTIPVAQPVPAPPQIIFNRPVFPPPPFPPRPVAVPFPPPQLRPVLPSPVAVPAPVFPSPAIPIAPQYNYVIRPGNAVQTSLFATYPRYPLYPLQYPVPQPQPAPVSPLFFDRPAQIPHYPLLQHSAHGLVEQSTPIGVEPTPTLFHAHAEPQQPILHQPTPTVQLDHNGWSPIQGHGAEGHFVQEGQFAHDQHSLVHQEQVPQVYEHHQEDQQQQFHDYQHHLHQLEQAQFDQQQHHPGQEYGPPQEHQLSPEQLQELHHQQQDYYNQQHQEQYHHDNHNYQPNQEYGEPQQLGQEYGAPQQQQQLGQEYGTPQPGFEGRSSEDNAEEQKYHNHIPLGLQPPLDRPLENFDS